MENAEGGRVSELAIATNVSILFVAPDAIVSYRSYRNDLLGPVVILDEVLGFLRFLRTRQVLLTPAGASSRPRRRASTPFLVAGREYIYIYLLGHKARDELLCSPFLSVISSVCPTSCPPLPPREGWILRRVNRRDGASVGLRDLCSLRRTRNKINPFAV